MNELPLKPALNELHCVGRGVELRPFRTFALEQNHAFHTKSFVF